MPFKRQRFKVEGQAATVVSIEDRALSMRVPLLQLGEVPRFPLTAWVSGGVGQRDDVVDVCGSDAGEVVERASGSGCSRQAAISGFEAAEVPGMQSRPATRLQYASTTVSGAVYHRKHDGGTPLNLLVLKLQSWAGWYLLLRANALHSPGKFLNHKASSCL